jgi:hypothetical protein
MWPRVLAVVIFVFGVCIGICVSGLLTGRSE